jgi:gentisate 1,2-dioxygenase
MRSIDPRKFATAESIEELHSSLATACMFPGWNKSEPALWPTPKKSFVPAHWSYALAKPALDAAAQA